MKLTIQCKKCGKTKTIHDDKEILKEVTLRVEDGKYSCCEECFEEYKAKREEVRDKYLKEYRKLNYLYFGKEE